MKLYKTSILAVLLLAACNQTDPTLGVKGETDLGAAAATTTPAIAPPTSPVVAGVAAPAVALSAVRMRFAPIIGAPVDKVTALSRRLTMRAKEKTITIVASTDTTATHVLKGYFSVLAEGTNSTVIYVFDVLDPSGNRLHRIQGQESVAGTNATDSWAAVPPTLMETIADKAINDFTAWQGIPKA